MIFFSPCIWTDFYHQGYTLAKLLGCKPVRFLNGYKITAKNQWCCGYILALSTKKTRATTLSSSVIMPKSPPRLSQAGVLGVWVWFFLVLSHPRLWMEPRLEFCYCLSSDLLVVLSNWRETPWVPFCWLRVISGPAVQGACVSSSLEGSGRPGVGPRVSLPSRENDPKTEGVLEAGLVPQNTLNKFSWCHSWPAESGWPFPALREQRVQVTLPPPDVLAP